MAAAGEVADEMHRHGAGGRAVADQGGGEDPEAGVAHRGLGDGASLGVPGPLGAGQCRGRHRSGPADGEGVQRHGDRAVNGGEDEQRAAPAEVGGQPAFKTAYALRSQFLRAGKRAISFAGDVFSTVVAADRPTGEKPRLSAAQLRAVLRTLILQELTDRGNADPRGLDEIKFVTGSAPTS
ncbi:hypothetical protein AB0B39_27695 [Micromonospora sp. NPDC049114]|uniref:hypothetical protein n=1 Tax=unclassified Micromonospora TaxID=2617518 RepID=UPI003407CEEC